MPEPSRLRRACLTGLLVAFASLWLASMPQRALAKELRAFESAEAQTRYRQLTDELRCLVCQNQNIADSDAELARDLRDKVDELIKAGKTDQDIVDYMVERYGDFVLYRPPMNTATLALWFGPALLVVFGILFLYRHVRALQKRRDVAPATLSDAELDEVDSLLERNEP